LYLCEKKLNKIPYERKISKTYYHWHRSRIFSRCFLETVCLYKLEETERGVIFRQFTTGLDKDNVYEPGFHIIAPWNDMYVFNVSEQKVEETMDVLDKNGLSINIEITVRFYPIYNKVGSLYEAFRTDYANVLVVPEVRSSVRQVAGRYTAEEIIQQNVLKWNKQLLTKLVKNYVKIT
jgi:regulator of protease activity HflC (stomatin/prohibitin superfamily)